MRYDFNTSTMKDKVQISIEEWVSPEENLIEIHKISGRSYVTYITKAKFVGKEVDRIKSGDYVLLSKVACDIATTPTASYSIGNGNKYFNIPPEQVMGTFKDNKVTFSNLIMREKNVLFKRIVKKKNSNIFMEEKDTMLGEIVKVNVTSSLKVGDKVAVRDNVSTPIKFGENEYFAVEEKFIVGTLHNGESINDMKILNGYILMKPYISKNVLNSKVLITPDINFEDLDYSDINNRNLFKVFYADKSLNNIKEGDILLLNRDYTNYMYYENERYFVVNEEKWISGKIIERDKQCN